MKVILHGYWRSSSTWRVRIALHHKGVAFETKAVHLQQAEQRDPTFRATSPMEQVPVLEVDHGGHVHRVTQSMAIVLLAEQLWPDPPLLPGDPWQRARALEMAEIVNSGIQPLQNLQVLQRLKSLGQDDRAWAAAHIEKGLHALESLAAAPFATGEAPTVADAYLVPQLYNARRFGVDLTAFPRLVRIEAACAQLPSFLASHPDRQPDAPEQR